MRWRPPKGMTIALVAAVVASGTYYAIQADDVLPAVYPTHPSNTEPSVTPQHPPVLFVYVGGASGVDLWDVKPDREYLVRWRGRAFRGRLGRVEVAAILARFAEARLASGGERGRSRDKHYYGLYFQDIKGAEYEVDAYPMARELTKAGPRRLVYVTPRQHRLFRYLDRIVEWLVRKHR